MPVKPDNAPLRKYQPKAAVSPKWLLFLFTSSGGARGVWI